MKKYESYKPSGIEWIGDIPEHWGLKKQKYVAKLYTGDSLNDKEKEEYSSISDSTAIPYIASKDIDRDTEFIDYENGMMIPQSNEKEFVKAPKNSFLLCIEGGSAGKKMGYLDRTVCFVNKLCCFDSKLNKYHYYYIKSKSFSDSFVRCLQGMIGGVSVSELSDLKMPVPPFFEQSAIVDYLDKKCSKIDNVVAIQQKRIELLKELKQSIITKTVTKGLDKNAKMKDSGIEWIGEMPEEWKVMRIKYVAKQNESSIKIGPFGSALTGKIIEDGECKVYGQWNIIDKDFSVGNNSISRETFNELISYKVFPKDILISMMGTVGKCAIIPNEIQDGVMDSHVVKIRLEPKLIDSNYFEYVYDKDNSQIVYEQIQKSKKGSIMDGLNSSLIKDFIIPVPPLEEQTAIAAYLDLKCATIDKQIQKVEKQIELLKEYKQSVITECVTGKRKVC